MISLLLAAVLGSVVADVTLNNGTQLTGELKSFTADTASVQIEPGADGLRRFARVGIKEIRFPSVASQETEEQVSLGTIVELTDGTKAPCKDLSLTDGRAQVDQSDKVSWSASSKALRSIRWKQPNDSEEQWDEIIANAAADDLLVIRRQSLDYLKGVVLGISKETVQFQYSGNTIPVPRERVAGVIFSTAQEEEAPPARLMLATTDGGAWALKDATLDDQMLLATTASGVEAKLPLSTIQSIEFSQLGTVFLTDLEPSSVTVEPFFGSVALANSIEALNAPRFDVDFEGGPLRIASNTSDSGWEEFERGLAIQSRTEIVYRLAGKYQQILATAGIALGSPSQADVELRIFADEREVFTHSMRSGDPPKQINVDISNARRLRLVVDFGKNANIGDRLHLGDARLLK